MNEKRAENMGLYEILAQSFPEENVSPYGLCLIIPHSMFKPEWQEQLEAEGVQVFSQAYNGRICFFLRKRENQTSMKQNEANKRRKRAWTTDEIQLLFKLKNEGLSVDEIAKRLNRTPSSVRFKLFRLKPQNQTKQVQQKNSQNYSTSTHDFLGEFLEALNLLYSKGLKNICIFLLKHASTLLTREDAENG